MAKDKSKDESLEGQLEGLDRSSRSPPRCSAPTVAKKGLNTSWKAATGKNPPANPADPDVDLWEAVLWAAVSGTAVELARMLATRQAAKYYAESTGHLPPGVRQDDQDSEGGGHHRRPRSAGPGPSHRGTRTRAAPTGDGPFIC